MEKEIKPITLFIVVLLCILICAPLCFWLGKKYFEYESQNTTTEVETGKEQVNEKEEEESIEEDLSIELLVESGSTTEKQFEYKGEKHTVRSYYQEVEGMEKFFVYVDEVLVFSDYETTNTILNIGRYGDLIVVPTSGTYSYGGKISLYDFDGNLVKSIETIDYEGLNYAIFNSEIGSYYTYSNDSILVPFVVALEEGGTASSSNDMYSGIFSINYDGEEIKIEFENIISTFTDVIGEE